IPVDVRILSATHKDLARLVERGLFRQDLFYRINVIELRVPPLRERREDVPRLTARVLQRLAADNGMDTPPRLQPEALKALLDYGFPGNVRELENILERAVALCENGVIERGDLMLLPAANGGAETAASLGGPGPGAAAAGETTPGPQSLDDMVTTLEREKIMQTLQKTRFNKTAAARELGITFRALRYKLKKLGID
ncbi:helix-turn-helix domain-containing protein, partial [Metallibacterium sp.]|uniref:helix-turn-helix domain-containing protein n=1 Tax=Metallibacterium sp. TaxID=2940281 RepID=UPI0026321BA3